MVRAAGVPIYTRGRSPPVTPPFPPTLCTPAHQEIHPAMRGRPRPEPLRSPPAARDILENRPNRKTRIARGGRARRLWDPDPLFRDRVVRAVYVGVMVDGHRTVQTPERASPGECGSAETF